MHCTFDPAQRGDLEAWLGALAELLDAEPNEFCGRRVCLVSYFHEHVRAPTGSCC